MSSVMAELTPAEILAEKSDAVCRMGALMLTWAHPQVKTEASLAAILKDAKIIPIDDEYAGNNRKRIVDRWVAEVVRQARSRAPLAPATLAVFISWCCMRASVSWWWSAPLSAQWGGSMRASSRARARASPCSPCRAVVGASAHCACCRL